MNNNDTDSDDMLHLSDDGDYDAFNALIERMEQRRNDTELTPEELHQRRLASVDLYISTGNLNALIELIDAGFPVDSVLGYGGTPLQFACVQARYDFVEALIHRGADPKRQLDGSTTLILACSATIDSENTAKNVLNIVKLLLEKGVDPKAVDRKRRTALMMACSNGCVDLVYLLLPISEIESLDNQSWNALFYAVEFSHVEVVKCIIEEGINENVIDVRGFHVGDLARRNGCKEIAEIFPELLVPMNHYGHERFYPELEVEFWNDSSPRFFPEISRLLYGSNCETLEPLFMNSSLSEYLAMNDEKLQTIGVRFPYQRRRILDGLKRFHRRAYNARSVPFPPKTSLSTNVCVAAEIITCMKQMIAIEGALKFIMANSNRDFQLTVPLYNSLISKVQQMQRITKKLLKRTKEWDATTHSPDLITKKRRNIPYSNIALTSVVLGAITLSLYYYKR